MKRDQLAPSVRYHLRNNLSVDSKQCSPGDLVRALALAVRERHAGGMLDTEARFAAASTKRVYYLSMEFLIGRLLESNLLAMGLLDEAQDLIRSYGFEWERIVEIERDAALGNGGLGRLAACFLDSMATLGLPGTGYGINYDFGLFRQEIRGGRQHERPDVWNVPRSPWLLERPGWRVSVPIYGYVEHDVDRHGRHNPMWLGWRSLIGVADDLPVVGYGGRIVNRLRLFSARASDEFDMEIFNTGDYIRAVEQKIVSETVTKLLYPSDAVDAGRELRLIQEYFLVACAMRDIWESFDQTGLEADRFAERVAIQLNDTHPALAVAELMRVLVDEKDLPWEVAWDTTRATCAYTNHTLLPEALEKWPVPLVARVLPRHLELIYEINRRFLESPEVIVRHDAELPQRVSLIEESEPKQVRMAHLAIVGSHSVNGVAALHSELIRRELVPDFASLYPDRFNNKTNGITPRRWLLLANPGLAALATASVGERWISDLFALEDMATRVGEKGFLDELAKIKRHNKERLAAVIARSGYEAVNLDSVFDVQAKRIHEYKRQLLNLLHVVYRYLEIVEDGRTPIVPRTVIFAGKAAPGYWAAKAVIRLIHRVAATVNADSRAREWLRVVFLPDYRVSLAERLIPGADLSEQISTAGTEASGTGNMKFALNGALTIGTLDGANIEIMEAVGRENILIFGLTAAEVQSLLRSEDRHPRRVYESQPTTARVVNALRDGRLGPLDDDLRGWLGERLLDRVDQYCHLHDLGPYLTAQRTADQWFADRPGWLRRTALNICRMGRFSSDRTIGEYASEIWRVRPVP